MTSYNYSASAFPGAPRPTPASNKPARAPIYNPYDKFSQNEFDSWIGGITGALRKALGQDDEEEQRNIAHSDAGLSGAPVDQTRLESQEYPDSEVEDSFAELKARRDKGKGRDPREGPGLGGEHQPIILGSDSEEEEDAEGSFEGEEDVEDEEEGLYYEGGRSSEEVDEDAYGPGWDEEQEGSSEFAPETSGHNIQHSNQEEVIAISSEEEDEGSSGLDEETASDVEGQLSLEGELDHQARYSPAMETVPTFYSTEPATLASLSQGHAVAIEETDYDDRDEGDRDVDFEGEGEHDEEEEDGWDEEEGGEENNAQIGEEYSDDELEDDTEHDFVRHPATETGMASDSFGIILLCSLTLMQPPIGALPLKCSSCLNLTRNWKKNLPILTLSAISRSSHTKTTRSLNLPSIMGSL